MGHLTRSMAIARRLPQELTPIMLTMSKGLPTARRQGFFAEYFPSSKVSGLDDRGWTRGLAARVSGLIEEHEPAVVAFDGIYPYGGLRIALKAKPDPAWVWIRRAMWRPDARAQQLEFSDLFDAILEPGEFAREADRGRPFRAGRKSWASPRSRSVTTPSCWPAEQAEAELGLEPGRVHALMQLGEVPQQQRDFIMQTCASQILQRGGTQVAILESAISTNLALPTAVVKLASTYPIARLYPAFDFVISAAGYNSYHELIRFQVPAAFFPVRKPTDDQGARARFAEEAGVGVEVGLDATRAVGLLLDESERRPHEAPGPGAGLRQWRPAGGGRDRATRVLGRACPRHFNRRATGAQHRHRGRARQHRRGRPGDGQEDHRGSRPGRGPLARRARSGPRHRTGHAGGAAGAAAMKLQHLVVTRLTVKLFYEGFSRDWLEERLRLFRTYCVPGMAAQTIDDYQWLILCDEDTDPDFVESIEETRSLLPQLHVASTSKEHGVQIPDAVRPFIEADTELLITTRLDGDDSLHSETIESVQSYADAFARSANQSWLLDFPRGYRYDETSGRLYESFWMSSPFSSLFEKLRPGRGPARTPTATITSFISSAPPTSTSRSRPGCR